MPNIAQRLLALTASFLSGCGFVPEEIARTDPRLAPMLQAIATVDRASFGFTPIPDDAEFRLESRPRAGYDTMLHIDAATSRTVAFRKTATGYTWIHEQEIHTGPKKYTSPDGTFREEIVITYETRGISGRTPGQLDITYFGEDARLADRHDLTLDDVRPFLAEWSQNR